MLAILHRKNKSEPLLDALKVFVKKGNWSHERFEKLNELLTEVRHELQNGIITKSDILEINTSFDKNFMAETLQGHSLRKPYSYPGDFILLDKIYTNYKTKNARYRIWDDYFQKQLAIEALRNGKDYFKNHMILKSAENANLKLLNVLSGPGRALLELYDCLPKNRTLNTTCVEIDDYAIAYSKGLNNSYLDYIEYEQCSIFNYKNTEQYNVIWSAGLCNYLDDQTVLLLLNQFKNWLLPGGEIILGNLNQDYNPSRNYLELMGDWQLIHRSEKHLIELAKQAGFIVNQIKVGYEVQHINLFLHLKTE